MEQKHTCSSPICDRLPPLSAKYPWVVAQDLEAEDDTDVQIFYNIHDPLCHYRCRIPELLGKRIRGCFYGWVILSKNPHNVMWSLWNPVTSKLINLPPLIHKLADFDDSIRYCCLSSSPDDPSSILLMTRTKKPNLVFCRLDRKKKKLRWTEMTYGKQVRTITGKDGLLHSLTCCNGKVYAFATGSYHVVELSIVVMGKEVVINLLPLLKLPSVSCNGCYTVTPYLKGSCTDLFSIVIGLEEVPKTFGFVYLFKLEMSSMTWEKMEDLQDTTFSLEITSNYSYPPFYSPAIESELGGYIHVLGDKGKIIYSYHVKDKTISLSSVPCLAGTNHVSAWGSMLEYSRLEGDHERKDDKTVSKVRGDQGAEFNSTADESHLPFDLLESIMEFCVGVEYINFRATCKRCHLAAPIIKWSNQTASKRLQLQKYSLNSPWLMVFDKHIITFMDPMFGDKYFIKTPRELEVIGELKIHYSKYGWLLMRKYNGSMFFFNPFTSDIRELPQSPYLKTYCFSAPPTSPDCMVVGFTTSLEWSIHIHFVGRESSWRRLGLSFGDDDPNSYRFPTFYGRDVYALCNEGGVDVFKELGDEDYTWDFVLEEAPTSYCTSKAQRFLVNCNHEDKCDQHLLLVIVGEFGESIEVFKPNDDEKWEKIYDIGRHMIYICDKAPLCMEAKTPEMGNKIYFPRLHSEKIVFYSLETCKFHTFNGKDIHESFGDFFGTINHLPPHAWIEPSWS